VLAAKNKARVIGIDISAKSVNNARERAVRFRVDDITSFLVMDCETLGFKDNTFDLIFSSGMLGLLDIPTTLAEWVRVLKPDGCVIGVDALGHNPFLNFNRKRKAILGSRSEWTTHMIHMKDLEIVKEHFYQVDLEFFHLATLFATPFRQLPCFLTLLEWLNWVDTRLLQSRLSFLQKYAHKVVFTLMQPKKSLYNLHSA
jgi:SAM-dependent methyltransferase